MEKETIGHERARELDFIGNSLLTCFTRCPRRFFYCYMMGLRNRPHCALKFGEAIHAALPAAYDFEGDPQAKALAGMFAFRKVWADETGDDKRNPARAAMMLLNWTLGRRTNPLYVLRIPDQTVSWLKVEEIVGPYEVPFSVDLGLPVPFQGRMDGEATVRGMDIPRPLDFKTTSEMGTRFLNSFVINSQLIGYAVAMDKRLGIETDGAIVDSLQVAKTKAETHVFLVDIPAWLKEDWLAWVRKTWETLAVCIETGVWTMNPSACTPYCQFGQPGYPCDYMDLCLLEDWTILEDRYFVEFYRPFKIIPAETTKEEEDA